MDAEYIVPAVLCSRSPRECEYLILFFLSYHPEDCARVRKAVPLSGRIYESSSDQSILTMVSKGETTQYLGIQAVPSSAFFEESGPD